MMSDQKNVRLIDLRDLSGTVDILLEAVRIVGKGYSLNRI